MSKAVLMSIKPQYCGKIASGKKTIEVRKTKPKLKTPFKCYIYCTYGQGLINAYDEMYPNCLIGQKVNRNAIWGNCCNGRVIGEFVCDEIYLWNQDIHDNDTITLEEAAADACLTEDALMLYADGYFYGWHISEMKIYDKPKELSRFIRPCPKGLICEECGHFFEVVNKCCCKTLQITRPPQSWMYVEEWDFYE